MAKERSPEDLARAVFVIGMAAIGAFIAAVFLFIL